MAARKKSSSKRKTKKEQMEEQAKIAAFKKETFLWIVVAVSILLFISNMGIGGHVGGTVSGFLFGVFAMVGGLILVPIVSAFTQSTRPAGVDEMFECYHGKKTVDITDSLGE